MNARRTLALHARTAASASVLALLSTLPAAHAQTTDTWSLGASGLWSVAGNWSADVVPNNGAPSGSTYNVGITDGTSTVTLNINAAISDLTMGSGNTLAIDSGDSLLIFGPTVANAGKIQLNGGAGGNGILDFNANTTLSGAGTLTLSTLTGGGNAIIQEGAGGVTLTNQSTIQGAGVIGNSGLTLVSSGTIDANTAVGGVGLTLNGAGVTNSGLLEATAGGTLTIATNVVNTGAHITASGTGSIVDLDSVTITGGTLTASSGGALEAAGNTTLTGVTIASGTLYPVAGGTTTTLNGSFTDNGTIQISGGNGTNAILDINSNLTLAGPVTLSTATGGGNAIIQQSSGGVTLTTQGTIQGAGVIGNGGLTLVSSGTIDANTAVGGVGLTLNGAGVTNTGLLEATAGGTLTIATNVVNTGAHITASGTGSVVDLDSVTITGGTLTASSGGALEAAGNTTLTGVTIASGTLYPVAGGTTTTLNGPITNNGSIQITGGNGSNAVLNINNNLTLAGPVTLSTATGGGNAIIEQSTGGVTLTTQGTVQGAGVIGNGGLTLVNSGTLDANTAAGTAGILLDGSGGVTNTGLLEATNGGTLTLAANVVDTGAHITASGAGSIVDLDGVSITGGTLTASGGGALETAGNSTLTGVTIASGTLYPVAGGTTTTLVGPITNNGTIQISGGNGSNSILDVGSNLSLGGTVTMTTATGGGSSYIQQASGGVTLTNTGTIQGAGVIGNGGLALVNTASGVIDANATGSMTQTTQLLLNGSGGITNSGLLEAATGNTLLIENTVANAGGNITASGANSLVSLNGATITGGTLNTSGGGSMTAAGSTSLTGVTISSGSAIAAANGSDTYLGGTIANGGALQLSGGGGSNGVLNLASNVTLTGGGTVTLAAASGGGNAYIQENQGGVTLTNTNNTIEGNGIIGNGGLTVVNSAGGTISSNAPGGTLVLNGSGGLTNSGTLQVSSGDLLQVTDGPFTNFSGTTLAGGKYNISGTLEIDALGTTGGEIVTNAAGITLNGPSASFVDADGNSALTKLAANSAKGVFTLAGDADFTTGGNFTNKGALVVGAGSTFTVTGKLTNFVGTTLTGGVYDVTGKLDFAGARIVTNSASITLGSRTAEIVNSTTKGSGLAKLATNSATGTFNLAGGANFTTAGDFSTAGTMSIGSASTFTVGGTGAFTQTAGTSTDLGKLVSSGGVTLSGGSLFGGGSITGNLLSSAVVTPGSSAIKTGLLTDTGTYTQNSTGSLDIGIGGTTAGTSYDALNSTTAVLGGTLNISQLKSFVPTIGSTFKILNFNSVSGTFATVNGLTINSTEAYTITYQTNDVLLTVVSTDAPTSAAAQSPSTKTEIPAARSAESPAAARMTAALRAFNSAYAVGGGRAVPVANNAVLARQRMAERTGALDLIRKGRH